MDVHFLDNYPQKLHTQREKNMNKSHFVTSSSVDCYGEVSSVLVGVGNLEECVEFGRLYLTEILELNLDDKNVNDQLEMSNRSLYLTEEEGSTLVQIFGV